jgi:hypothetical protein
MSEPIIRPADTFSPLIIEREFGRTVPVTCEGCGQFLWLKLVADEVLTDERCDELLDDYLTEHGWTTEFGDLCPNCADAHPAGLW